MEDCLMGFLGAVMMLGLIYLARFFSRIGLEADLLMAPDAAALAEHCRRMQNKRWVKVLGYVATTLIAVGSFLMALCILADEPGISWENFIGGAIYLIGVALLMKPYEQASTEYFKECLKGV